VHEITKDYKQQQVQHFLNMHKNGNIMSSGMVPLQNSAPDM